MLKKEARKIYKEKRMTLSEKERGMLDDLLLIRFQSAELRFIGSLLTYWPIEANNEPDTHLFTQFLRFRNPELLVCYPKSDFSSDSMQAVITDNDTQFTKTILNIFEPRSNDIVLPEEIDLVFVPLLAFDENGYRVGYGKGFYDKWLAGCSTECLKVGFSYFEPVESIDDRNDFDVPLNFVSLPITCMFSSFFLKSFRILLLPFALLYWLGIGVRNWLYNKKILQSTSFALPLICIGNLSVGGTGKSPMVEYLVRLLKNEFRVATLSRGYKRRTKGYALANSRSTALEIGDEPMQFHIKFPDVPVAVGEERLDAIPQLLQDRPGTEAIILDDAFQHRAIKAGLNIVLTEYSNLFTRDFYLPTGDLRDLKSEYKRAEVIVVTKCKPDLSVSEKQKIIGEINPQPGQSIFFASIEYSQPYHIFNHTGFSITENTEVLLVSGIANPRPLKALLEKHSKTYYLLQYADHRIFTIDDLKEIRKRFETIETVNKIILTTEKDAVRLVKFKTEIADWPLYVIAVRHHFLYGDGDRFNQLIINFIRNFGQPEKK